MSFLDLGQASKAHDNIEFDDFVSCDRYLHEYRGKTFVPRFEAIGAGRDIVYFELAAPVAAFSNTRRFGSSLLLYIPRSNGRASDIEKTLW